MSSISVYKVFFTKSAAKDLEKLNPKTKSKLKRIIQEVLQFTPYVGKKLLGDLLGNFSYRLSIKDRIIYSVDEEAKAVYIKRARTHYGD